MLRCCTARTVHEVDVEEYRILESVNYELVTHTPGDWVKLFEVRFIQRTQQYAQRFPQATRSLLARVASDVLASGALCIVNDNVRDRFSLDSRPSRIGSSAWFLSCVFWICLQQAGCSLVIQLRWLGPILPAHVLSRSQRFLCLNFPSQFLWSWKLLL